MRKAFTLFEMILVMVIILAVGALATPMIFEAMYGDTQVMAAADIVRARWADCRTQAIEEGRPYQFSVVPNTGRFKVEPFDASLDGGQFINPDAAPNSNLPMGLIIEDVLPTGVRFETLDSPANFQTEEPGGGEYVKIAVFKEDGSAQSDVEIRFGSKGTASVVLRLRALTGAATTIRTVQENKK